MKYIVKTHHHRYDGVLYHVALHTTTLHKEVRDWLREEVGNRGDTWDWPDNGEFVFLNEIDAMAFKLRWL